MRVDFGDDITSQERKYAKQAIEIVEAIEPNLPLESLTFKRNANKGSPTKDDDYGLVYPYFNSYGSFRRKYGPGVHREWIIVAAGANIDDAIAVLFHEFAHAIQQTRSGASKKIAKPHSTEFFMLCAELYAELGCTEAGSAHDGLVYRSSIGVHRRMLPEDQGEWLMQVDAGMRTHDYKRVRKLCEEVFGKIPRVK